MNKFLTWLIVSSADPNQFSARLKGLLIVNVAVIMWILHTLNVPISVQQVTDVIGYGTAFIGTALMAFGLIRNIYLTLTGKAAK